MMSVTTSLDFDEAGAVAARWRQFADDVEHNGAVRRSTIDQLRHALGDVYAGYVDAEERRLVARKSAFARIASEARRMADRLDNTRNAFAATDAESASSFAALATGEPPPRGSDLIFCYETGGAYPWLCEGYNGSRGPYTFDSPFDLSGVA
jgi:hypothetical protein